MSVQSCCLGLVLCVLLLGAGMLRAAPAETPQVVLALDLAQCPDGAALETPDARGGKHPFGPPNAEVDKHFAGWEAALSGWMGIVSNLKVEREGGTPVLVHIPPAEGGMTARALVGGAYTWRDYAVEAPVRLVGQKTIPNAYGDQTNVPYIGVFARMVDLNRFYMLALEPDRLVLYRREIEGCTRLASQAMKPDPAVYVTLRLEVAGDALTGYLNGAKVLEACDDWYETGKAGVRCNTEARLKSLQVRMTRAQQADSDARAAAVAAEVKQARGRYPTLKVLKTITPEGIGPGFQLYPTHLQSATSLDYILTGKGLTAGMDVEGKILWRYPATLGALAIGEPDAAGVPHLAGVSGKRLVMLDGRTGQVLAEAPAPEGQFIYHAWRLCNRTGKGQVNYVLRSGDNTAAFWLYDENLKLIHEGKSSIETGHTHGVGFWDVDGDGREELLVGGSVFRGDGQHLWDSMATENHTDQVILGPLGPAGQPTAVLLGNDEGVTFLDGVSGATLAVVPAGHPQGTVAGDFRPDREGLEVLTIARWSTYGMSALFSGRGELLKQWMIAGDEYPTLHHPVSWGPQGDLIMISRQFAPPTLYDGHGHEIMQLPEPPGYRGWTTLFPRDLNGDGYDEILSVQGPSVIVYGHDQRPAGTAATRPGTIKWMNMSLPAAVRARPNLLVNGGFEATEPNGAPTGWTLTGKAEVLADPARAYEGARCVKANFDNGIIQDFPVKPETTYLVTGMVRHAEAQACEPGRLKIGFFSAAHELMGAVTLRLFSVTDKRWTGFSATFQTPPQATQCNFTLRGRYTGSDWMLYDNVCVREAP